VRRGGTATTAFARPVLPDVRAELAG